MLTDDQMTNSKPIYFNPAAVGRSTVWSVDWYYGIISITAPVQYLHVLLMQQIAPVLYLEESATCPTTTAIDADVLHTGSINVGLTLQYPTVQYIGPYNYDRIRVIRHRVTMVQYMYVNFWSKSRAALIMDEGKRQLQN